MQLSFEAPEYRSDGTFETIDYSFAGDPSAGWKILRKGRVHLELPPGYVAIRSVKCGVCSTDLARRFLPYPLPQVIGHEVVGLHGDQLVVVEINASHEARGAQAIHEAAACPFCSGGLATQCPERITLGINQLPGGFGPYLLAPEAACIPVPTGVPADAAVLTEPLAAALHAVESTPPGPGHRVAVVGPRRLGALVIVALEGLRRRTGLDFELTAVARHGALLELARELGADRLLDSREPSAVQSQLAQFDLVFDTTGSLTGFELARSLCRRTLHLKSTNGQPVAGLARMTDLVVDEGALLAAEPAGLDFAWPGETRRNSAVFVAPRVPAELLDELRAAAPERLFIRASVADAAAAIRAGGGSAYPSGGAFPRFDLAVAADATEADQIIRPHPDEEFSIVRPRGAILMASGGLPDLSSGQLQLRTSRCGNFRRALALLADNPDLANTLQTRLITQHMGPTQMAEAFETAADSQRSIKVVVDLHAP